MTELMAGVDGISIIVENVVQSSFRTDIINDFDTSFSNALCEVSLPNHQTMIQNATVWQDTIKKIVEPCRIFNASAIGLTVLKSCIEGIKYDFAAQTLSRIQDIRDSFIESVQSAFQFFNNPGFEATMNRFRFMYIADQIGFPIYLETDTELQELLIGSYKAHGYNCNIEEMRCIVMDYYSDQYIDNLMSNIRNVGIFKPERIPIITEGLELYQERRYAGAGSVFTNQMSGMIHDIYNVVKTINRLTWSEKKELLNVFEQHCDIKSEKSELLQIVSCQTDGVMVWQKIVEYFLNVTYSTKNTYIQTQPLRNPISHGNQLNFNTQEMNLKLILCMDILLELAWRIKKMKEEQNVVEI